MYPVLLTIHIVVGFVLIVTVLLQSGRRGGFSNLMGGGGGDALFSTSGQQSGLRKLTMITAGIFLATSFGLTLLTARQSNQSVFQQNFPALPPVNMPAATEPTSGSVPAGMPQVKDETPAAVPQAGALDSTPVKK